MDRVPVIHPESRLKFVACGKNASVAMMNHEG